MKLLNVLKKYNKAVLRENAKLKRIYTALLKESGMDAVENDDGILDNTCECDVTTEADTTKNMMSYSEFCKKVDDPVDETEMLDTEDEDAAVTESKENAETTIDENELVCASEFFKDVVGASDVKSTPDDKDTPANDDNPLLGDEFIQPSTDEDKSSTDEDKPVDECDTAENPLLGDAFVREGQTEDSLETTDEAEVEFPAEIDEGASVNMNPEPIMKPEDFFKEDEDVAEDEVVTEEETVEPVETADKTPAKTNDTPTTDATVAESLTEFRRKNFKLFAN